MLDIYIKNIILILSLFLTPISWLYLSDMTFLEPILDDI